MAETELITQNIPALLEERVKRHWADWQQSCQTREKNPAQGIDIPVLGKIWACSEFAASTMLRHPELWFELLDSGSLQKSLALSDYYQLLQQRFNALADPLNDAALMKTLRQFRQQQMLRIAWRDLAGVSDTLETLRNLTDLAEACVDNTLELLHQDMCKQLGEPCDAAGTPQRLVVLGMGKLGGHELNYSSDIDLIFSFSEEGETTGTRALASSQFFTRLGQRFIKVLNDVTADGFVFRVDMRLRPYGDSGPLVMSYAGMEQYYQTQGRDWERYAMIKARVIGGDRKEGKALLDMLRPFIYRRYLDFGAFQSIREMKALIDTEIRRKGNQHNIKLGPGGIREIEFVGQTFQLIRGGNEPELQIRGILAVLALLEEKAYLEAAEVTALVESYHFLRRLENRLQMYADEQTHLLPDTAERQISMALAMGYDDWASLLAACDEHRRRVHVSFTQLLHEAKDSGDDETERQGFKNIWLHHLDEVDAIQRLDALGIQQAEAVYHQLEQFRQASQLKSVTANGRQRLDTLMPALLALLVEQPRPAEVLKRVLNLLQAVLRRSVYLSLLNEYPSATQQLVKLCAASPWVAHLLSRYPVLLDELLDARNLYQIPTKLKLRQELDELMRQVMDDEEQQLERLRQFKQAQVLKIAAMDIAGVLDVFEVSEQLSNIAEVLLDKVIDLAWGWMLAKHGKPVCLIEGEAYHPVFGVVAYGKLGGKELSYSSDLDLVFVHDSQGEQQQTDGARVLDNSTFFARLAQRVIHLLSVQTANGRLYEVDMRLRPDGNAGMLVSSMTAFDLYQHNKAWTWEHQALIRARMVCSSPHLKVEFDRIRRSILTRERNKATLAKDVVDMRNKMRESLGSKPGSGLFHLKQDEGGLVDIEFIAQFGTLLRARQQESLINETAIRQILLQLAECGILTAEQAEILYQAYQQYRELSHQLALQELSSQIEENQLADIRQQVRDIWRDVLEQHVPNEEAEQ